MLCHAMLIRQAHGAGGVTGSFHPINMPQGRARACRRYVVKSVTFEVLTDILQTLEKSRFKIELLPACE